MSFPSLSWTRQRLADFFSPRSQQQPSIRRPHRCRPAVEGLEDRTVLSAITFPTTKTAMYQGQSRTIPIYSVGQIQTAYGLNQLQLPGGQAAGAGQTIAIIDTGDDPAFVNSSDSNYANSDLAKFDLGMGIQDPPHFTKIAYLTTSPSTMAGGSPTVDPNPTAQSFGAALGKAGTGETSLDIEWAHAIAPGANIILVEYEKGGNELNALQFAASLPNVSVVSASVSFVESGLNTGTDGQLTTPSATYDFNTSQWSSGHNNVTFVVAAGDDKNVPGSSSMGSTWTSYPANSVNVVAVGATMLTLSSNGGYGSEAAWHDSEGGTSLFEPSPSYQSSIDQYLPSGVNTNFRQVPDVAMVGSDLSELITYNSIDDPGYSAPPLPNMPSNLPDFRGGGNGTSIATPQFAGVLAIANQLYQNVNGTTMDGVSYVLPQLYKLPQSDFHSITSVDDPTNVANGNTNSSGNGDPRIALYNLSSANNVLPASYNLFTGRGSPNIPQFVYDLAGVSPPSPSPGLNASTTTLTSSANPAQVGQAIVFTAAVSSTGLPLGGFVTFLDNGNSLGSALVTNGVATLSTTALTAGTHTITAAYSGDNLHAASPGAMIEVVHGPLFSTFYYATGTGPGVPTVVSIYGETNQLLGQFNPFAGTGFTGSVRVATGDVSGDGIPDLVVGSGPGGVTAVIVYDGASVLANPSNPTPFVGFNPYGPLFSGGVYVAVGRLDGKATGEIITGADAGGGPQVNIYSPAQLQAKQMSVPALTFYAYASTFTGGVRVAAGDVNGDGLVDLITAAGPGGGPQVNVYFGARTATFLKNFTPTALTPNIAFYAFGPSLAGFTGGVFVTSTFVNGDGRAFIILGAGAGGAPEVTVYSGTQLTAATPNLNPLSAFFAFPAAFTGGVSVGSTVGFLPNGKFGPLVVTGAGPGGGPQVDVFDLSAIFRNPTAVSPFAAFFAAPGNLIQGVSPSVT